MVSQIFWNKRANRQIRFTVIIAVALALIAAVALLTPVAYGNGRSYRYIPENWWLRDGCSDLTSLTIPDSVMSIEDYEFQNCKNFKSVTLHKNVVFVNLRAFQKTPSLTSIEVAADNAHFSSKDGVLFNKDKTVLIRYPQGRQGAYTIPNSVTEIDDFAFFDCTGLTSITIPNSVDTIRGNAFAGCIGLTSITIPNSVTTIERNAFARTGLTSIAIPSSVTFIEVIGFAGSTIEVAADNAHYSSKDGVLFNKDKTILIGYPQGRQGAYTIPNSVTTIGNWAFAGCTGLTSITIPNSVINIGHGAFAGCTGLTSITIPNSVTNIRHNTFKNCIGLTSIIIPNSVGTIEIRAFSGCTGLTSITIPNSVTTIESWAFKGCTSLTSIIVKNPTPPKVGSNAFKNIDTNNACLYIPPASIEAYQAAGGWRDFKCIKDLESAP